MDVDGEIDGIVGYADVGIPVGVDVADMVGRYVVGVNVVGTILGK